MKIFSRQKESTQIRYSDNILIFFSSLIFILILEHSAEPYLPDGLHFQSWSSDRMMQTVPIKQLREYPLLSLWYLHIQPPVLDAVRALVSLAFPSADDASLLRQTDQTLYVIWALVYSLISTLIYRWVSLLTHKPLGLLAGIVWILHPAPIFYATLLDSTLLSACGTTWLFYELWRTKNHRQKNFVRLSSAMLFVFFTRTVFQWYFFPILLFSVYLMNYPIKRILSAFSLCMVLIFFFLMKQYMLFHTLSTTTFSGYHYCGLIWHRPDIQRVETARQALRLRYPEGAERVSGGDNTEKTWQDNIIYTNLCRQYFLNHPILSTKQIIKSFRINLREFLLPSSLYKGNIIVNNLPWRNTYNAVFGNSVYVGLAFCSLVLWYLNWRARRTKLFPELGLFIPFLYIFMIINLGNRYEWTESDRLKFILEPTFHVFLITQLYDFFKHVRKVISADICPQRRPAGQMRFG